MQETIIELSEKIKNLNSCKSCSGTHQNGICMFCGLENQELIYLSSKLEKEISKLPDGYFEEGQLNNCLTSLYLIRNMEIPVVTKILNHYNYINTVDKSYFSMFSKINEVFNNKTRLTDEENYLLLSSYLNDEFNEKIQSGLFNLFSKKILDGKNEMNISNVDKEKIFLKGTELIATQVLGFKRAHARILEDVSNQKEETLGEAYANNIDLSRKVIHENPIELLPTIFHELVHLRQYKEQEMDYTLSEKNMVQIKDKILRRLLKGYYNDNYQSISFEKEAFLYMNLETMDYLNGIGLEIPLEIKEDAIFYKETCSDFITNKDRVYSNEVVNLDELFNRMIVSNPKFLTSYPQLLFEYKIVDNEVIPKTLEEIQIDYQDYQNGTLNWNGNQEEINNLYQKKIEELEVGKGYQ